MQPYRAVSAAVTRRPYLTGAVAAASLACLALTLVLVSCSDASSEPQQSPTPAPKVRAGPTLGPPTPPPAPATETVTPTPEPVPPELVQNHVDGPPPQQYVRRQPPPPGPPSAPPPPPPPPVEILHGPPYTVFLEAGHGGPNYIGSANQGLAEKDLTLDVVLRLAPMLSAAGYNVVLARSGDYTLTDFPADTWEDRRDEIQARVDIANAANADILVSVHFNGGPSYIQGLEIYYNPDRSFGTANWMLAESARQGLLNSIRAAGYDVPDRGIKNDAGVGGCACNPHSWVLGTNDNFRPSMMPGIIAEPMFLSNNFEAQQLWRPEIRQAVADGYKSGIDAYFGWIQSQLPTPTPTPTPTPPPTEPPTPQPTTPAPTPTVPPPTPTTAPTATLPPPTPTPQPPTPSATP